MDGWMNGWMNEWMDEWMVGYTDDVCVCCYHGYVYWFSNKRTMLLVSVDFLSWHSFSPILYHCLHSYKASLFNWNASLPRVGRKMALYAIK